MVVEGLKLENEKVRADLESERDRTQQLEKELNFTKALVKYVQKNKNQSEQIHNLT